MKKLQHQYQQQHPLESQCHHQYQQQYQQQPEEQSQCHKQEMLPHLASAGITHPQSPEKSATPITTQEKELRRSKQREEIYIMTHH